MTENLCADVRLALGALALGALEPAEEQEIRDHLAACPACAAEARSMEETAAVLALVDGAAVGANDVDPSPGLLDRLLADVGRQRWRRRAAGLAAAAAVAVAAGIGGAALVGGAEPEAPAAPAPVVEATGQQQAVALSVAAWDRGWGTAVQVTVSGVPAGSRCSLVAVGSDGSREVAATWQVPGDGYSDTGGDLTVDGAVGLRSWDVDHYAVETVDGETLVTARP